MREIVKTPVILRVLICAAVLLSAAAATPAAGSPSRRFLFVVPPGHPKFLAIHKLGVRAPVESVSLTHKGDAEAPYHWGDVAWYSRSARPGNPGRAWIYGHLDSYCCPAVFYRIRDLHAGDTIDVTYRDGRSVTFRVRWNRTYPKDQLPVRFMSESTRQRGLFLITCAGIFHRGAGGYDHRTVVYATLSLPPGAFLPSLASPVGARVDPGSNLYVADAGNNRISVFNSAGVPLRHWGAYGSAPGKFNNLSGIAISQDGRVYVADSGNRRIQVFTSAGRPISQWGPNQRVRVKFRNPVGIALDARGDVYVADAGADRIMKLSPEGAVLATWGRRGYIPGRFRGPDAVAVDEQGNVYVADAGNGRIQELAPDGTPITEWTVRAHGKAIAPAGVALDRSGHVFVVSSAYDGLLRYSVSGEHVHRWGKKGSAPGDFRYPAGVTVDSADNVYVADSGNSRVQKLSSYGRPLSMWR